MADPGAWARRYRRFWACDGCHRLCRVGGGAGLRHHSHSFRGAGNAIDPGSGRENHWIAIDAGSPDFCGYHHRFHICGAASRPTFSGFCGLHAANAVTARWTFLARERFQPAAAATFLSQGIFFSGALLFVRGPQDLMIAAWAQVAGELAAALYLWMAADRPMPRLDSDFSRALMKESWPVTMSLFLGAMMYNFDMLALSWMGRKTEVGLYLAGYRCITVFSPLLGVLQSVLLPRFSRSWPDYGSIRNHAWRAGMLVALALTVAALLLSVFAEVILTLLFGSGFSEAAKLLRVMAWILPVQGARVVARQILLAYRQQHWDSYNVLAAVAANVILDFALIPRLGALGCAFSTLASEVVFLGATATAVRYKVAR